MKIQSLTPVLPRVNLAQVIVAVAGAASLLTGVVQLLAPQWFFDNIGFYPPFNRHYVGDLGSVILPMGIGLLIAARDPAAHRLLIGVAAAASSVHVLNHLYDDLGAAPPAHGFLDTLLLLAFAVVLIVAWQSSVRTQPGRSP